MTLYVTVGYPRWPNFVRCGLLWTVQPDNVCLTCRNGHGSPAFMTSARGRAHAMRRLGLPVPWAPRVRRRMFWEAVWSEVKRRTSP